MMTALNQTFEKMNRLNEEDITIIVNLVDYLADKEHEKKSDEDNPFHKAWEEGHQNPMTEDEVDSLVSSVRKERNARRN